LRPLERRPLDDTLTERRGGEERSAIRSGAS
jgi:hypothetical protein